MPRYIAAHFPISGQDAYWGYIVMYGFISLFGALSALVDGIPAISETTIPVFALFFPLAVFVTGLGSLLGVIYSFQTTRVTFEYVMSTLLLAGLLGYAAAIANRALWEPDADIARLPSALLPFIIAVFPFIRLRRILPQIPRKGAKKNAVPPGSGE